MTIKTIQDILPLIEQPSRYLGSEINAIKKDLSKIKLCFALVFPDLYEIGMSHFGLQILYHILNRQEDIAAERVFAPAADMEAYLRSAGLPLTSLESQKPLDEFDIIGFSLLSELNFTNILKVLELANLPFLARQREGLHPLIIAGGPCTCNPEPVADFFDAVVIGDGENVIMEMCRSWMEWKSGGKGDKERLLNAWSEIESVYVPEFFKPKYDSRGFQTLIPKSPNDDTVKRAIINNLDEAPFPATPIIPYSKPVHDRLRLEVSRGCTRGCRFCQAGIIYRPVRERSPKTLLSLSDDSLASTGYEDISLLSLSTGDYHCIAPLMECLMARLETDRTAVSLPSLRAGTLTPELMNLVKRVRKTGFTIAPEAGSQRLRNVINKNISEKDIIDTVKDAFHLGWQVVKLYFMVGLPTETDDDLKSIVELVQKLKNVQRKNGKKGRINVSVATFIPKPHTPFQWTPQISLKESKQKINGLKRKLKIRDIHFKWQNPEVSYIEGLWTRGDRRLSRLLIAAYKKGCSFDGWTDMFHYRLWQEAILEEGIDTDFYTTRTRNLDEPLPWDHIDTGVQKDYLVKEWRKAEKARFTEDCRNGDCNDCGVCDFETIEPRVFDDCNKSVSMRPQGDQDKKLLYKKLKLSFSKLDQAKYFGHLELVKIFLRAIRRADIPVKFSEGFHPKPLISFEDSLPVGLESQEEIFYLTVPVHVKPQGIKKRLNRRLPKGLYIQDCQLASAKKVKKAFVPVDYLVIKKEGSFDKKALTQFKKQTEWIFTRTHRNGKTKTINLKEMVFKIELLASNRLKMTLRSEPGKTVRPPEVLKNIFQISEEAIKQARVIKFYHWDQKM